MVPVNAIWGAGPVVFGGTIESAAAKSRAQSRRRSSGNLFGLPKTAAAPSEVRQRPEEGTDRSGEKRVAKWQDKLGCNGGRLDSARRQ